MKTFLCIIAAIFFGQIPKIDGTHIRNIYYDHDKNVYATYQYSFTFLFPSGFLSDDEDLRWIKIDGSWDRIERSGSGLGSGDGEALWTEGSGSGSGSGMGCFLIPTDSCTVSFNRGCEIRHCGNIIHKSPNLDHCKFKVGYEPYFY
jgi:hypothetical protein